MRNKTTATTAALTLSPLAIGIVTALSIPLMATAETTEPKSRLEEILVTASMIPTPRREVATAVSTIDLPEIQLRGYDSLADLLRTQPGIGVGNAGGAGKNTSLKIRGEEGYRTTLIIDGVKTVDSSGTQASPTFDGVLATRDLQRVEILRGPQGFMYGADAGGVINVMTLRGEGPVNVRLGAEYGEFSTQRYDGSVSGGNDTGDYFVAVTDVSTDGFNSRSSDVVLRDTDGDDNQTLHTKLGLNVSGNLRLQLVVRHIDDDSQYDDCFGSSGSSNDCRMTTDQTTYKVSADHHSGNFTNSLGYSDVTIDRTNFTDGAAFTPSNGDLARIDYTGSYKPSEMLGLVYGIDLEDEQMTMDAKFDRKKNGYYAEYQGNVGKRFYFSAGARYDDNDDFGSHVSSRVSAAYVEDLGDNRTLKYRTSYGTGFRAPSLYEISYNAGPFSYAPAAGLALSEEDSKGADIGVEYDVAGGVHFEATYFDQKIENEIFFDLDTFSGYLQSNGTSDSTGIELAATAPLGMRWEILGNWTHNDAKNSTNTQRLRRPKNLANVGFAYHGIEDKVRFIANYRIARDAVDSFFPGTATLPDYDVLDLSAAYSLTKTVEVYGRIRNATDEQYVEVFGYNTAGRAVYAGVRLRF